MPSTKHVERRKAATFTECSLRECTGAELPCVSPERGRHVQHGKKSRRHCISSTATHIEPFFTPHWENMGHTALTICRSGNMPSGASCYVSSRLRRTLYERTRCNNRPSTESTQNKLVFFFPFRTKPCTHPLPRNRYSASR